MIKVLGLGLGDRCWGEESAECRVPTFGIGGSGG